MNKPKLAVLTSRFPYPIDKGDKLRLFHQLRDISAHMDIYLFALHQEPIAPHDFEKVTPFCTEIKTYKLPKSHWPWQTLQCLRRQQPLQIGYFSNPTLIQAMQRDILRVNPEVLYVQLSRMMPYAEGLPYPMALDLQDCFSLNYARAAQRHQGPKAWFYQRESRTMAKYEKYILNNTQATTIISPFDKQALPLQPNNTVVIPNGVDTHFFKPDNRTKDFDFVFVGNLSYQPNQAAVHCIVEELVPILKSQYPNVKVHIAGANMPTSYKAFNNENITCSGWVDDIRTAYASARIFVAPLWSGAGLQNKLLEAMSMGMPCITTPIVNASLGAIPNNQLFIANQVAEMAQTMLDVLGNTKQQEEVGTTARQWVIQHYPWGVANQQLVNLLQSQIKH